MNSFVLTEKRGRIGIVILNRPDKLNAWHRPMRQELMQRLSDFEEDETIRAILLTGAGDRAFSAGQDLTEAQTFDAERGMEWIREWEELYGQIRSLTKPLVAALNGVAAGSAFQVALLADFRIGHAGVRMGQPEINSGIASTTGPWIMREMLGLARTIDLTLTGRLMDAEECRALGLLNSIVPQGKVLDAAIALAEDLASKAPIAMRLNKRRFQEMTEAGFRDCLDAGIRNQRESYGSGEPARMMRAFFEARAGNSA